LATRASFQPRFQTFMKPSEKLDELLAHTG